jgi:uncharacterized protein
MASTRRDFIQISATAASALVLRPLRLGAAGRHPTAETPAVRTFEQTMLRATPVALGNVRITGGPVKHAQDLDAAYLLSLDPDRMMAFYRIRAGLQPKAEPYGGWDGPGHNLTGHIAGHHLSAVSLMYQATGDARFKARADYLVDEMKTVQDKNGDGYLVALEKGREAFAALSKGEIRSQPFDLNGLWSPWYTLHKTFAGLRDAYRHTGNRTALDVGLKFAAWAEGVVAPLTAAQMAEMLNTEQGGILEVFADLYADTGDTRWLNLSYRFEHHAFTDALKRGQDNLDGKHGNCQIPKLVGAAARYGYTGDAGDLMAASFFWDAVTEHHTFASGGHGLDEYFGPADIFSPYVDGRTCESCNVYNMLKLTRRLFAFHPDAFLADFQERAIFNHVLSSIDPKDGRMCYMVPVGRGEQHEYQDMQRSFTCCVGTGMENHALYGDGLYYESAAPGAETLWVNLFIPSTAAFSLGGVNLAMDSSFPEGDAAKATLTMPAPKTFTLAVRRPSWAGDSFAIAVNGEAIPQPPLASLAAGTAGGRRVETHTTTLQPSTFVEIRRTWKTGDVIDLTLPKTLRLEPTPDKASVTAIMWGPLALAADWGTRREGRAAFGTPPPPVPVLVAAGRPLSDWIQDAGTPGDFRAPAVGRVPSDPAAAAADVTLAPFYRTYEHRYSLYYDVVSPAEFDARAAALAAERERLRKLEAATVAFVQPSRGPQEPQQFNYQSDPANRPVQRIAGRSAREGTGWFSYDLAVDGSTAMALVVTYLNEFGQPPASGDFRILVDGTAVGHFEPNAAATGFYDVQYAIPASLLAGKTKVTVRFEAASGGRIAPVFGVRTIRAGGGAARRN